MAKNDETKVAPEVKKLEAAQEATETALVEEIKADAALEKAQEKEVQAALKVVEKAQTAEEKAQATLTAAQHRAAEAALAVEEATAALPPVALAVADPNLSLYTVIGEWAGLPLYGTTFDEFTTTDIERMNEHVKGRTGPQYVRRAPVPPAPRLDNYGNVVEVTE